MKKSCKLTAIVLALLFLLNAFLPVMTVFASDPDNAGASGSPVGSVITFGSYPQEKVEDAALIAAIAAQTPGADGVIEYNGERYLSCTSFYTGNTPAYFRFLPISWRVLSVDSGGIYVIAEQILDCMRYNETFTSVLWAQCSLRGWLNDTFYHTAFTPAQQQKINLTHLVNEGNEDYGIASGGPDTDDYVWILCMSEVRNEAYGFTYVSGQDNALGQAVSTAFSEARGMRGYSGTGDAGYKPWWIRNPCVNASNQNTTACRVNGYGSANSMGYPVDGACGVRPAMKIKNEPADYSAVEALTGALPNPVYFTPESYAAVTAAVASVEENLTILDQARVDAMADAIRAAIGQLVPVSHEVTVSSGCTVSQIVDKSICDNYKIATVSAPKTQNGELFSYWADENGTPVSTYRSYSFLVTGNTALHPVYGADTDDALYLSRVTDVRDNEDAMYSILVEHSVASSKTLIGHGVLCTTEPATGTDETMMRLDNDTVEKYNARLTASTRTGLLEVPVELDSDTMYCRSYIIDDANEVHYGALQQFAISGADGDSTGEIMLAGSMTEASVDQTAPAAEDKPEPASAPTLMERIVSFVQSLLGYIRLALSILKF